MLRKFKPKEKRAFEEMKNEIYNVLLQIKSDKNLSSFELLTKLEDEIKKLSVNREELDKMDDYYRSSVEFDSDLLKLRRKNLQDLVNTSGTLGILEIARETLIERENIEIDKSNPLEIEGGNYRKRKNFLTDGKELDEMSLQEIHKRTDEMTIALFKSLENDGEIGLNHSSQITGEEEVNKKM